VQFTSPHSLDQWIHSKSSEITWCTRTPFAVVHANGIYNKFWGIIWSGCSIQVGLFWHGLHYYFSRYENRGGNAIERKTFTICHWYPLKGTTCLCKHFQAYHWLQKSSRQKVWKSFTTLKPNGFWCLHLSKVLFWV